LSVEKFTSGQAIAVDVGSIERDLAALWRQSAESGKSVARACQWNLVVHAPTDVDHDKAKKLADAIVVTVPTRTIIVRTLPNATGAEVEAFVTANCQVAPGGGKMLCTEEITIEARGRGVDHVPSLLRALQVPDIPTASLFVGQPPSDPARVRGLVVGADRVIVDSARVGTTTGRPPLASLAALVDGPLVCDLNWLRLASLRYVLAGVYDPPAPDDALFKLKRVKVRCSEKGRAGALLLLGWLGSRLAWGSPERVEGKDSWTVPRAGGAVRVDVDVVESSSRHSGLVSIHLDSDGGFKVALVEQPAGVLAAQSTGGAVRTVAADEHRDHELLVAALGARGRDKLYATSLLRAVELER
jgi:glucose-6-phosphate dehydrogenase assembly protein OpcA